MEDAAKKLFTDAAQKKRTTVTMRLASAVWKDTGMLHGIALASTFLAGLIVSTLYDAEVDEMRVARHAIDHCVLKGIDREKVAAKLVEAWRTKA